MNLVTGYKDVCKYSKYVGQTVLKMSPIDFSSHKTVLYQFLAFYVVLYENYSEI